MIPGTGQKTQFKVRGGDKEPWIAEDSFGSLEAALLGRGMCGSGWTAGFLDADLGQEQ